MIERTRLWWSELTDSLWFVPAAMILGAIGLAIGMITVSDRIDDDVLTEFPRIFGAGAQSSRQMLATIAGAMMTVAGVTFSITILAVAQASSQYTPRILRNFMRDRANQITLGTLTGVFVYCLVVLRTVRGDEDSPFIPALAVLMAFVLAIVAIGVLVYFIHHVASSLQASTILARVRDETIEAIDRLFPREVGEPAEPEADFDVTGRRWRTVRANRSGYISHLDADGLLHHAAKRDLVIRMERGVGEHVIAGTALLSLTGGDVSEDDTESLNGYYEFGSYRTVDQDPAFGFRQMVDMAVKALSAGVNDSSTAVASVDAIGAALARMADRQIEERFRLHEGEIRVIAHGPTFESLARVGIDEIRQNADGNVSVLRRLLATIESVATCTASPDRRQVLLERAERVLAACERSVADPHDRAELREAFDRARSETLRAGGPPGTGSASLLVT